MKELLIDYGLGIGVIMSTSLAILVAYKVGYHNGHWDGFKRGLGKGFLFNRLKVHEQNYTNN